MAHRIHIQSRYLDEPALISHGRYMDGSTAISLYSHGGEPLSTPTVCLTEYNELPREGYVFVRDYGPNEGMLHGLQTAGVIGPPIREVRYGGFDASAHECELLMKGDE